MAPINEAQSGVLEQLARNVEESVMDTQAFLLNHIQIQDTVTKLYLFFDTRQPEALRDEVFAKTVIEDRMDSHDGFSPLRSREELASIWSTYMNKVEVSQHVITGILPVFRHKTFLGPVDVWVNVTSYLRKTVSDGRALETRSGGRIMLEVVNEADRADKNPWRVSRLMAFPIWEDEGRDEFWQA